ncbi:ribonuclease HIII [Mesobacillus jeotgali]|jgi:ribonuclease HIII|uniref:Ribonuclease HIII n=1 Tax=Mesobacillus jeotgali TaxID=129985 RepID=A0ABY9VDH5_9BACI|nr:ribonuclease HIII [Mesobacillus jeotgali]WNF21958.1 ribonuclease HIII [Mesobacillus jeotgali]
MGNSVLQKSPEEVKKMKEFYSKYLIDKLPPGSVFAAKTPSCAITAYKSGKVLFQGKDGEAEAARWGTALAPSVKKTAAPVPGSHLPKNISDMSIIGSDEVGTGDFFGPITVVAAYVRRQDIPVLKELGVQDSKNLKDDKIIEIARQLVTFLPHSLLTLHNEKYNQMQMKGMSQGKMKALLHNQAINHVLDKIAPEKPEAILIDEFAKEQIYYAHLKGQRKIIRENVLFSTKAEGIHLGVAAASMIARYAFVRHFENLSKRAGFTIPKGAGAAVDKAAARLILDKGIDVLPEFVKLHFANTEKAKKIARI